jgi:hypothetical protein
MYRFTAVGFSLSVIALSVQSILNPAGHLSIVMSTDFNMSVLRIVLAVLLLAYSMLPGFRYDLPRKGLLFAGLGILWFLFVTLITDVAPFPGPVDLFFGLEGAVLALIAGLDFYRPRHVRKFLPNITVVELLVAKTKKLHSATTFPSQRKTA